MTGLVDPVDLNANTRVSMPSGKRADARFHNRVAALLWGFAAVFRLFVGAMSFVLIFDGVPPGFREDMVAVIMFGFWVAGLAFAQYAANRPCVRVSINADASATIRWTYPFSRTERVVPFSEIVAVDLVDSHDSDGEPYFYSRVRLQDGITIDIAEGHRRSVCRARCEKMSVLLGFPFSGA